MTTPRQVDHSALRTNQACIIACLVLGFVLNAPLLVAFVAAVMIVGTIWPQAGLFKRLYRHVLRPAGIVRPDVLPDNPEPHRFAMLVGALFNGVATLALLGGIPLLAWVLVGIVIVLANLNFWLNFCLGCWMYYQFNRLGIPGFTAAPIQES
jgi:hypothetical protein